MHTPPFSPLLPLPFVIVQVPVHRPLLERHPRPSFSSGALLQLLLAFKLFERCDVRLRVTVFRERDVRLRNAPIRLLRHALKCDLRAHPRLLRFLVR